MFAIPGVRAALLSCAVGLAAMAVPAAALAVDTLTQEQAKRAVEAVELLPADFPGYEELEMSPADDDALAFPKSLAECAGVAPVPRPLAIDSTAAFGAGDDFGSATLAIVSAMPSAAEARRKLAALSTPRFRRCYASFVRAMIAKRAHKEKLRVRVSVRPLWVAGPGTAGMRVRIGITQGRMHVIQTTDLRWLAQGPIEVLLVSSGFRWPDVGGTPLSGAAAHRITDALRARVDAALATATA